MKDFLKNALKTAVAFFLAMMGVLIVIWLYGLADDAYMKQQEEPYESVKIWNTDLKNALGITIQTRTKLISGNLMMFVEVDGYPKYFSDPRNRGGSLSIEFYDKDGFKVHSETIKLSEFTTIVDSNNSESGLQAQREAYVGISAYKRFDHLEVRWSLITSTQEKEEAKPKPKFLDHCAIGISKAERLKRLAQHGEVRETGVGGYSAGMHSLTVSSYSGELLYCN